MSDAIAESYDELPYVSRAFEYMHPNALARTAMLAGMEPGAPPQRARVLEVGCASGGNLIPMSEALPEATFVGIDLSPRQVADGQRAVDDLGLRNVRLATMDVRDVTAELGQFDYILCHGVYSWVPPAVQAKVLDVCRANLAPGGLACVSYNVYPGWHQRGAVREMMLYHAGDPAAVPLARRVGRARELIAALSVAAQHTGVAARAHGVSVDEDLRTVRASPDGYVAHDLLEPDNDAVYFHEFAARAAGAGLRYVGRAMDDVWSSRARRVIARMQPPVFGDDGDPIRREQYVDFVVGQTFRASVLCRQDEPPATPPKDLAAMMSRFRVAAAFGPAGAPPAGTPAGAVTFAGPHGTSATLREPAASAAMTILAGPPRAALRFDDLCEQAARRLGLPGRELPAADRYRLAEALLELHDACMLELYPYVPPCAATAGERPVASAYARRQAARDEAVMTNRRHRTLAPLAPFDRLVLPLLDGTRDRAAILAGVGEALKVRPINPAPPPQQWAAMIEESLQRLAHNWLLIA